MGLEGSTFDQLIHKLAVDSFFVEDRNVSISSRYDVHNFEKRSLDRFEELQLTCLFGDNEYRSLCEEQEVFSVEGNEEEVIVRLGEHEFPGGEGGAFLESAEVEL